MGDTIWWGEHLTKNTLSRAGFGGSSHAVADYEVEEENELYEIYLGHTYNFKAEEIEFLVVDLMNTGEKSRKVWFEVFKNQNLYEIDGENLCALAQEVVRERRKVNYGDLELTFRDTLKELGLFRTISY